MFRFLNPDSNLSEIRNAAMGEANTVLSAERAKIPGNVALVHDFLLYRGGAERVLRSLADMFPGAPIYTLLYDAENMGGMFADREVRTSFLGAWPEWIRRRHRLLLPFYPTAAEAIDLRDFSTVISSSGAWAKGIVTRLRTKHIAYLHSPMRFVWDENERYLRESGGLHFLKRLMLSSLRLWDFESAQRPDVLVANSFYTERRIKKYYRREAKVVYPPVLHFQSNELAARFLEDRPFLTVSRLSPYKRTRDIVQAFSKLKLPLAVVGSGAEFASLSKVSPPNIRFFGHVTDEELGQLYRRSRAFLFASDEDFGLSLAEAQRAGLPAIALRSGGAMEIVSERVSGVFFDQADAASISRAVGEYIDQEHLFDREHISRIAERFSEETFRSSMSDIIKQAVSKISTG